MMAQAAMEDDDDAPMDVIIEKTAEGEEIVKQVSQNALGPLYA
jgi:hypothetical protein